MKKYMIAVLAALSVVSMAMANEGTTTGASSKSAVVTKAKKGKKKGKGKKAAKEQADTAAPQGEQPKPTEGTTN